ncbi:hypothetical protein GALL_444660 [mine drainage metagenome]|uniref:Uncharacterized protein n=1 Tax=mine drainage metagenome TaxID=410659 RepID=A0A1J5PRY0_9ZZZZ
MPPAGSVGCDGSDQTSVAWPGVAVATACRPALLVPGGPWSTTNVVVAISAAVGAGAPVKVIVPAKDRPVGSSTRGDVRSAMATFVRVRVRYGAVPPLTPG